MKLSVIVSTYNSPEWLQKVFWGYAEQTYKDFEILVADDGSKDETAALIEATRQDLNLDIRHVWQQDKDFRKCRILNKAILQAREEYIVFTDGDCIPRRDFLQIHHDQAKAGHYLSGSYYKLPMQTSKTITREDIRWGRCFWFQWLRENGLPPTAKRLKISCGPLQAKIFNTITPTACNLKGSNASVWKKDLFQVGGFDERMAWGGEDRELGVRLINSGIKPKHVRYNAICVHLDHGRPYKDPEKVAWNKKLRKQVEREKIKFTDHGLAALENPVVADFATEVDNEVGTETPDGKKS